MNIISCVKIVAEAEACDDTFGERSDLFSQTCNVHVHRAVEHQHVLGPHAVDKLLA